MFTGILAYADDIVLLAPTAQAMRKMLRSMPLSFVPFNTGTSKSNCVICMSSYNHKVYDYIYDIQCILNGHLSAKSWPHLGHIITNGMNDEVEFDRCRHNLIGQVNDVLCTFRQVDSIAKFGLF